MSPESSTADVQLADEFTFDDRQMIEWVDRCKRDRVGWVGDWPTLAHTGTFGRGRGAVGKSNHRVVAKIAEKSYFEL
jgi:hypothetical protein